MTICLPWPTGKPASAAAGAEGGDARHGDDLRRRVDRLQLSHQVDVRGIEERVAEREEAAILAGGQRAMDPAGRLPPTPLQHVPVGAHREGQFVDHGVGLQVAGGDFQGHAFRRVAGPRGIDAMALGQHFGRLDRDPLRIARPDSDSVQRSRRHESIDLRMKRTRQSDAASAEASSAGVIRRIRSLSKERFSQTRASWVSAREAAASTIHCRPSRRRPEPPACRSGEAPRLRLAAPARGR